MIEDVSTPMMKQYQQIKNKYADCILFFRMGDFYEMFFEDARVGAKELGIVLTRKASGKDGDVPMAGVPYHSAQNYITKLVSAGYRVAICEQLTSPNGKSLVERDVIRIVTPSTLIQSTNNTIQGNFIMALVCTNDMWDYAIADIATGFIAQDKVPLQQQSTILQYCHHYPPAEWIIPPSQHKSLIKKRLFKEIESRYCPLITVWEDERNTLTDSVEYIRSYIAYTQKSTHHTFSHVTKPLNDSCVFLNPTTIDSLSLFPSPSDPSRHSLFTTIDHTKTPIGKRKLRDWIRTPLISPEAIVARQNAVNDLLQHREIVDRIRTLFDFFPDMERTLARIVYRSHTPHDVVHLKRALQTSITISELLTNSPVENIHQLVSPVSPSVCTLSQELRSAFVDNPPFESTSGNIINTGYSSTIDSFKSELATLHQTMHSYETELKKEVHIPTLKLGFNKVFGYYFEVSKSYKDAIPSSFQRMQTLVNAERFVTPELKSIEQDIVHTEEKLFHAEKEIYDQLISQIVACTQELYHVSETIATIDVLISFALLAQKDGYVQPEFNTKHEIHIEQGKHPILQTVLNPGMCIANDTRLDIKENRCMVITGPNMAGKSVYGRQAALIVLLGQIGAYVPAKHCSIHPVDAIYVRSGASDNISNNMSTFMVEMTETAEIVNGMKEHSLIIMDEIGRGTSTYDGISIAWAVVDYLLHHASPHSYILFATHYHELQQLEETYPTHVKNWHMGIDKEHGNLTFLYSLARGSAEHSFGIHVAEKAGLPAPLISKATEILQSFETSNHSLSPTNREILPNDTNSLESQLRSLDIHQLTPLQALNTLALWKEQCKNV